MRVEGDFEPPPGGATERVENKECAMELGIVGLGRMGANMARRLMRAGHRCVVQDIRRELVEALVREGAAGAGTLGELAGKMGAPQAVWLMLPAAIVDRTVEELAGVLAPGSVVVDGGNSYYRDDIRRAAALKAKGLHYVDVGTSGGVWGLERGYCLMIGGEAEAVARLEPVLAALAPGRGGCRGRRRGRGPVSTAEQGYLHCGPAGAGHFVKMVHNGIEYGLMAAYAEGLNILKHADIGKHANEVDAETTPLRDPEGYQFEFDLAEIAELWRRGSGDRELAAGPDGGGVEEGAGAGRVFGAGVGLGGGAVDGGGGD